MSVHSTCFRPTGRKGSSALQQRDAGALGPAPRAHARLAVGLDRHVEREADAVRAEARETSSRPRSGCSMAALPTTTRSHALCEHIFDDLGRAHAAAHLDAQRLCGRQRNDGGAVGEHAVLRTVEIDDVQPRGAVAAIALEQVERVVLVARLGVEVALEAGARSGRCADRLQGSAASAQPEKVSEEARAGFGRTFRMELGAPEVAAADDR